MTTSGLSTPNDLRRRVVAGEGCGSDACPVGVVGHEGGDYKETYMRITGDSPKKPTYRSFTVDTSTP